MIYPFSNRVLLKALNETVSAGGILLPSNSEERFVKAKVISKGDGHDVRACYSGQTVIFDRASSLMLKDNGEEYWLVGPQSLLAYIEE